MSHFEQFDQRKTAGDCTDCFVHYQHGGPSPWTCPICGRRWIVQDTKWVPLGDDERRLKEALVALNRAMPLGEARLERIRDEVWALGVDLYGWTD